MDDLMQQVAAIVCAQVDWDCPGLATTPCAEAFRAGEVAAAALGLMRYLREREQPFLGYSADYVRQLRAQATPAFREQARRTLDDLLPVAFLGGDWPDGRGTLLAARPEVLQVAGRTEDFEAYGRLVAESRETWGQGAIHTVINLVRYLQAVWPLEECSDEAILPLFGSLAAQMEREWEWARRWNEHSHGSDGHNWWVAQFGGMWKAGFLFPEFKGFAQFQAFYPDWFEREMRVLIFPDGMTRECSVAYHLGTTDLFLDAVRLAEANGLSFSADFYERLRLMGEVEWKLLQPDGNYPAFGDCFSLGAHLFERGRSLAALLDVPEAKYLAEHMDPGRPSGFGKMLVETLNYPSVGEDLQPAYEALETRRPATVDTCLAASGYYAMRSDWTTAADYAAIEASPHGTVVSSHGHSAIFDLKLCARGRALLIGNGKGPDVDYANPRRRWRVTTPSHSATTVDGEDNVLIRSTYRFGQVVLPTVDAWVSEPSYAYFSGVHEGYERLDKKVSGTRRKLFYLRGDYWILVDRFTAGNEEDEHTYRQHFQVGASCRLAEEGCVITEGEGGNLLFLPVVGASGEVSLEPCPYPLEGYPAPEQLVYTQAACGHGLLVTVLVPFGEQALPEVSARLLPVVADGRTVSPWEVTGLEVTLDGRADVYVDVHTQWNLPWQCEDCRGSGRLFHSACHD